MLRKKRAVTGQRRGKKRRKACAVPQQPSDERPHAKARNHNIVKGEARITGKQATDGADRQHSYRHKAQRNSLDGVLDETAWRQAIAYYFLGVLDAPHTREWSGRDGAISIIVRELKINYGSRDMVKNVLISARAALYS